MNIIPGVGTAIILKNINILSGFNGSCGKHFLMETLKNFIKVKICGKGINISFIAKNSILFSQMLNKLLRKWDADR